MKNSILLITATIALLIFSQTSSAQVGFAIALDENRSGLKWQVSMAETTSRASRKARSILKREGYEKVTTQPCKKCGFELSSGYWIVVQSDYKTYDGKKTGFGLGISTSSYSEAERRAVKNLSTYNWSWSKSKHGYNINDRGKL